MVVWVSSIASSATTPSIEGAGAVGGVGEGLERGFRTIRCLAGGLKPSASVFLRFWFFAIGEEERGGGTAAVAAVSVFSSWFFDGSSVALFLTLRTIRSRTAKFQKVQKL
ncbi:hypothetical protein TNCT_315371 [Trichonephila clavata]|uniref:Uncharacterized protein n=1 Tax=Trichonephila clavata TaxID=2740835 RepID=A0A8X6I3A7_TRICU|nr:hypothetical protein TNCT_315371 [Trichonephila clavata]